jgi:hypothetical protein
MNEVLIHVKIWWILKPSYEVEKADHKKLHIWLYNSIYITCPEKTNSERQKVHKVGIYINKRSKTDCKWAQKNVFG